MTPPPGIPSPASAGRVANLRDIIASKQASGRQKDRLDLPLLESFRLEYEKRHAPALRTAAEITRRQRGSG